MERRFAEASLATIRRQAMIYACACPAQVSQMIGHLRKLHDYQTQCLNESPLDAVVHARIATAVEVAHREMETCLAEILALEGWDPVTFEMPANLQKRIADDLLKPPSPEA